MCRSPGHLRPLRGDGGGDVPPPGKRRSGSALKREGVGRSPSLSSRMWLGAQCPSQSFLIPLGITGADDESSSLALCVIVSRNCGSPDRVESDWMHETARCIGYPSDSTRAAREQGRGATCGHRLSWPGPAWPARPHLHRPRLSPLRLKSLARPCGSSLALATVDQSSPLWLYSGRRRAVPNCHWSWVSSRAACWCAGSPVRIATVVLAGRSGAGSGRGCRT